MAKSKNSSVGHLDLGILKRLFALLGCLVFIGSMVSPFLYGQAVRFNGILEDSDWTFFWSYKSSIQRWGDGHRGDWFELWFYDYWNGKEFLPHGTRPAFLDVFPFIFAVQILTLVVGVVSVLLKRRILAFAPIFLCLTVILLMSIPQYPWYSYFQPGYWLTYPSLFLFILAFITSSIANRKRTTSL